MNHNRHFHLIFLAGLAVFVLAFTTTTFALSNPPNPPVPERQHLVDEDFGEWGYTAYREGKEVTLQVTLKDVSLQGLEAFRAANQKMAFDLIEKPGPLVVTVVLDQPLTITKFRKLVEEYELKVGGFQMRVIDGFNGRVTLFGSPDDEQLISEPLIQSMTEWVRGHTGEAEFLGVVTLDAELSPAKYHILLADPAVFLIDVTPSFMNQHLQQEHASLLQTGDQIAISAYPVYWYLESSQQSQP